MATGRFRHFNPRIGLALVAAALAGPGCAQPGPIASRQTTLGTLKASVSHLEFENENLRNQVGELKAENTRFDSRLAQEIEANGELSARLDDARAMVRRQGGDATALGTPSKARPADDDDDIPPPVSFPPARRSSGRGRKPPAASIPRADPPDADAAYDPGPRSRDLGPQGRLDDDRWLPVARGLGTPVRY